VAFAYYKKLNPAQKKIYRASDGVHFLRLPWGKEFKPFVAALEKALNQADQGETQKFAKKFVDALCQVFQVPSVHVKVLARRPSAHWGELHGLYESEKTFTITVWMRTAKRHQVVAFKTFLRTVLHEVLHHLDYHLFHWEDSFHTEGFYKRESSLLKQLLPPSKIRDES
jgi:hypothetical protein